MEVSGGLQEYLSKFQVGCIYCTLANPYKARLTPISWPYLRMLINNLYLNIGKKEEASPEPRRPTKP